MITEDFDFSLPGNPVSEMSIKSYMAQTKQEVLQKASDDFDEEFNEEALNKAWALVQKYKHRVKQFNTLFPKPSTDRDEWLRVRHDWKEDGSGEWYAGASALAAIMGLHPYVSALQFYCETRGEVDRQSATRQMLRGLELEKYVAMTFQHVTGWEVRPMEFMRHPKHPNLAVNPDYECLHPEHGWICLELKTHHWRVRDNYGEDWSCDIPHGETIQGNWQTYLWNLNNPDMPQRKKFIVAVMFGLDDSDMHPYMDNYSAELGVATENAGLAFFKNHLIPGIKPDPSGSPADTELIKRMYRNPLDNVLTADERLNELVRQLLGARSATTADEVKEAELTNRIKDALGDNYTKLVHAYGKPITWNKAKDSVVIDYAQACKDHNIDLTKYQSSKEGSRRFLVPK